MAAAATAATSSAAANTSGLCIKLMKGLRTDRLQERQPNPARVGSSSQENPQKGSKRLQIRSGRAYLFDDEGFLASLGRKLFKRIQTSSRLKKTKLHLHVVN